MNAVAARREAWGRAREGPASAGSSATAGQEQGGHAEAGEHERGGLGHGASLSLSHLLAKPPGDVSPKLFHGPRERDSIRLREHADRVVNQPAVNGNQLQQPNKWTAWGARPIR